MTRVSISDLSFGWPGQDKPVLTIEHFELEPGARVLMQGPSGSGKSTLLSAIAGVVDVPKGAVTVAGTDLGYLPARQRDTFRADHFGMVFQMFNLIPWMSARENIMLPIRFSAVRRKRLDRSPQDAADRLLEALGLDPNHVGNAPAAALSVGQQQRVAAARALIGSPEIILADEPTSALDTEAKHSFLELLVKQIEDTGGSLLMVSHDVGLERHFDWVVDFTALNARGAVQC